MDSNEQFYWLLLSRIRGNTPTIRRSLQAAGEPPGALLDASEMRWRSAGAGDSLLAQLASLRRRGSAHPAWQLAARDQDVLQAQGSALLVLGQPGYPPLLAEIYDPPPLLYATGKLECLQTPQLAVVGSRRCSASARRSARELAAAVIGNNHSVCSGLALGIDAEAHAAALGAGGHTVAIMATGIERYYPRQNRHLAALIAEQGLLLTEFVPGSEPRREHFPRRNRIISGLSLGVLVIEASLRSGSLITARLALEQNREVFALPHSIYDPGGAGCHALIRQGAKLVETAADIFAELGSLFVAHQNLLCESRPALPAQYEPLYAALGFQPVAVDELVQQGLGDAGSVQAGLVELELLGLLEYRDGLYMRK
jgi:DNA processing protein